MLDAERQKTEKMQMHLEVALNAVQSCGEEKAAAVPELSRLRIELGVTIRERDRFKEQISTVQMENMTLTREVEELKSQLHCQQLFQDTNRNLEARVQATIEEVKSTSDINECNGDASPVLHYHQSMQWNYKGRTAPSVGKRMVTVFWDSDGIILIHWLEPGTTINSTAYVATLRSLRLAIQKKRLGKWAKGVLLQHDNAPPNTSWATKMPSLRWGYRALKKPLCRLHFANFQELKAAVLTWVRPTNSKNVVPGGSREVATSVAQSLKYLEELKEFMTAESKGSEELEEALKKALDAQATCQKLEQDVADKLQKQTVQLSILQQSNDDLNRNLSDANNKLSILQQSKDDLNRSLCGTNNKLSILQQLNDDLNRSLHDANKKI
ncbi:hypothetical protein ANN_11207, partial [Periplaneta americana]